MPRFIVTVEANGTTMPYRVEAKSEFDAQAYAEMKGYKVRDVERELPPLMPGTATTPPTAPGPIMNPPKSPSASAHIAPPIALQDTTYTDRHFMAENLRRQRKSVHSTGWTACLLLMGCSSVSCFLDWFGYVFFGLCVAGTIAIAIYHSKQIAAIDAKIMGLGINP